MLVEVTARCQATSHYLNQCRPSSMWPCGNTRQQWVKSEDVMNWKKATVSNLTVFNELINDLAPQGLTHWFLNKRANILKGLLLKENIDGLAQDCSNSSALAMELLQSCTKPSICVFWLKFHLSLFLNFQICINGSPSLNELMMM